MKALTEMRAGYGLILLEGRRFKEAEEQFLQAKQQASDQNDLVAHTVACMHLADLYLEQDNLEQARRYSDEMEQGLDQMDSTVRGHALSSRASLLAAQGDNERLSPISRKRSSLSSIPRPKNYSVRFISATPAP